MTVAPDREEVFRQLLQGIDALPPRLRQVFLMAIEGKTSADIAAELGVALETVKKQRQRGLKHLRRMLAPEAMLLFFVLAD